jgi:hypothetical protein
MLRLIVALLPHGYFLIMKPQETQLMNPIKATESRTSQRYPYINNKICRRISSLEK